MGMQISSLSMDGAIPVAVQQDLPQERRPPSPLERRKEAAAKAEAGLPLMPKTQAPDLKQTASELAHISLAFNRRLKFEIDQESKQIIVKVIDNETDTVIKVLPPEELQRLHSKIRETMGFLFDQMV